MRRPNDDSGASVLHHELPRVAAADPVEAGERLAAFGVRLFEAVAPAPDANFALSPYSIYSALAMTAAGARGAAATEFDAVLGPDAAQALTAIDDVLADIVRRAADAQERWGADPLIIRAANTLYADKRLPVRDEFLDALGAGVGAGLRLVDFVSQPEAAREEINRRVDERTNHLIPELLAEGQISKATRLALVNALYLKVSWADPFVRESRRTSFIGHSGAAKKIKLMTTTKSLSCVDSDLWTACAIPYSDSRLAMTVVLPHGDSLHAAIDELPQILQQVGDARAEKVTLRMPLFDIDARAEVSDALRHVGLAAALSEQADYSGMSEVPEGLVVSDVQHQAVVKVDEEGTEAAAATAVAMRAGALPDMSVPRELLIDRPFVFAIHDTVTGAPLFIGQVSEPRG